MTDKQGEELERIRHYVGTIDDFKNFWDQQAGMDTNAYGTPDRQGYGDVHPTRDKVDSPHWKEKEEQIKREQMREAVDQELGHTDDEAGMMANDLNVIARYAKDLEEMMKELEQSGQEVDFPHWWQSKIVLAKEYIVKAKHYIRAEMEKKPAGLPTFEDFDEVYEGFLKKDFKEISNSQDYAQTLFKDILVKLKSANLDENNKDLILSRIYSMIEGHLDSGPNKKYWREY